MDSADDLRAALLDAADEILTTKGPDGLTVRGIAEQAGCSTMGVYTHFGGKDGVVDALYQEGFRRLGAAMAKVRATADPLADLRRCGQAYRRNALENPTHYLVMFERIVPGFEPSPASHEVALGTLGQLEARIQRVIDAGLTDPRRRDATSLALDVWASLHGMVSLELHGTAPELDARRAFEAHLDFVQRGLTR